MPDIEIIKEGRRWWPTEYVDEIMPDGRESPTAWFCPFDDATPAYGCNSQEEEDWGRVALREGEIVKFMYQDSCGSVTSVLETDGRYSEPELPPCKPGETLWFVYAHDDEICGDSLAEAIKMLREHEGCDVGEGKFYVTRVSNYITFRFTSAGGEPRFEPA